MIGWAIARGERTLHTRNNADLASGAILAAGVILLTTAGVWMLIALGERLGAIPGELIAIIVASTTLSLRGR